MPNNTSAKSIAEVLAEAEKQKVESAKRAAKEYAQRKQAEAQALAVDVAQARKIMSGAAMGKAPAGASKGGAGKAKPTAPPPAKQKTDGLMDEFDYALEAVEAAKNALGRDMVAVERMATNILMAKAGVSREDAPRFIRKAIQYLDG